MLTICTVMKTGGDYLPEHVDALRKAMPQEIGCFTDSEEVSGWCFRLMFDLPGWWSKCECFNTEALAGDILLVDLDTVITGDLSDIIAACQGHEPIFLEDFLRPGGLQSSLVYMPEEARAHTWSQFIGASDALMERFQRGGDQQFLETIWLKYARRWQDIVPDQIVSYKKHCAGGAPQAARMVIYHGRPRPWDTELWHA